MVTLPELGALTVTLKLQLSPEAALAVTVVMPTGKKQSLQWLTTIGPHSSLPLGGEKWTIAPSWPLSVVFAWVVISSGQPTLHVDPPPPPVEETLTEADEVLSTVLGSEMSLVTVAVLVMVVPTAVPAFTVNPKSKDAESPRAKVARVHVTVPPLPTAGVVQLKVGPDV